MSASFRVALVYFVSENHVLWACSETMALPVMRVSFTWSNGVVDEWSDGKTGT